jgi:hypothetical protein
MAGAHTGVNAAAFVFGAHFAGAMPARAANLHSARSIAEIGFMVVAIPAGITQYPILDRIIIPLVRIHLATPRPIAPG